MIYTHKFTATIHTSTSSTAFTTLKRNNAQTALEITYKHDSIFLELNVECVSSEIIGCFS